MREIKFRAWSKETGMVDNPFWKDEGLGLNNGIKQSQKHYELMLFTGLKDKNGKEVYEGDILQEDALTRSVIYWDIKSACFKLKMVATKKAYWLGSQMNRTVIGNTYETPELLK